MAATTSTRYFDSFYDAVDSLKNGTLDHIMMNAVHPDAPSVIGNNYRNVFIVDSFISPSKPLVVATRKAVDVPKSIAVLYPSVANYTDTSAWGEVVRVTSGGLVSIGEDLLSGKYDSAIVYEETVTANADVLRIDEELGSPDDAWLVLGKQRTYMNSVLAWPDAPVKWLYKRQNY